MNNAIFNDYTCLCLSQRGTILQSQFSWGPSQLLQFFVSESTGPQQWEHPVFRSSFATNCVIQWFYITFYSIDIRTQQSGQFNSSPSHVAINHVVTNKLL